MTQTRQTIRQRETEMLCSTTFGKNGKIRKTVRFAPEEDDQEQASSKTSSSKKSQAQFLEARITEINRKLNHLRGHTSTLSVDQISSQSSNKVQENTLNSQQSMKMRSRFQDAMPREQEQSRHDWINAHKRKTATAADRAIDKDLDVVRSPRQRAPKQGKKDY